MIALDFKQITYLLYKRFIFIIAIPLFIMVIALLASLFILEPVYESHATLYVINKSDVQKSINYDELQVNQQLVKDYRELIKSRNVTKAVVDDLKVNNLTPVALAKKISVNLKTDTRILQISVKDSDPVIAMKLANKLSEKFVEKSFSLMNVNNINIVDDAELPVSPVQPRPISNSLIAFLISLILVVGIILTLEYLNDKIKSKEDIEEYLKLNVLGTIPLAKE